ncbi:MAG: class I SAM-dependent methyltransferase [Candidatus Riflebacteria bacterium]|jgi:SAM-dependent methyltransferase/uncharacterized protein YbaR (Trm112 family)|nr:class I SAM-dependent methyltransferase [Candidatus Riflebacteria bacterium]
MFAKHISWLSCVGCNGEIYLKAGEVVEGRLNNAVLCCRSCNQLYPVINGLPMMFSKKSHHSLNADEAEILGRFNFPLADYGFEDRQKNKRELQQIAVEKNWEYQWQELHPFSIKDLEGKGLFGQEAFKNFIPLSADRVKDATVLVGGAGRGREIYHLAKMGAKTIIAVDLGREILAARDLLPEGSQVELLLLRSDLVELPLKPNVVDIAICDHALQHVHDHQKGFSELARVCRASGQVAICVYSWEGNVIMTHLVEPAKIILHKAPLPVLFFLALFPSLILQLIIMLIYVPAARFAPRLLARMPLREHLLFWSQNRFKTTWMAIFDLFQAPISYHFKCHEVKKLAENNDLAIECLRHTNGVLWSLVANKE